MAELEQPVSETGDPTRQESPEHVEQTGLLLRGVVRYRRHERGLAKLTMAAGDELVEYHGLAALVHEAPYRLPEWRRELVREHSSAIERAMRRATIVPAPYGIVFRGPEQVISFLDSQYVALDEALSFLDGAFEMRLHITASGRHSEVSERAQADLAASFYTALRRRSRAAFTLPTTGRRILSAAFLVSRADWVSFVEYADELDADHPDYQFDLTGPWPAYDFVTMSFFPKEPGE